MQDATRNFSKMKAYMRLTVLLFAVSFAFSLSAQTLDQEELQPEGYVDSSGQLVLPLGKVLDNRRLMVRDMGRAFASCPKTHATLDQIREEMFNTEARELQARGYSLKDYTAFWNKAFLEGKDKPVASQECESQASLWTLMLNNIRQR